MSKQLGSKLREDILFEVFSNLTEKTKNTLEQNSDIVDRHNAYTLYVLVVVVFFMGCRPVRDILCDISADEINEGFIYFSDKFRRKRTALRLCGAPPFIVDLLKNYNRHLLGLACAIRRDGRNWTEIRDVATALHFGKRSIGVPYFFLISKNSKTKTITRKYIKGALSDCGYIESNIGRHWFATTSLERHFSPVISAGQLGHYYRKHHFLGRNSSLSILDVMRQQGEFVQDRIEELPIELLKGIYPYDSSWSKSSNLKIQTRFKIHQSELGPDRRHRRRREKYKKARVFVAALIKYLRGRTQNRLPRDKRLELKIKNECKSNGYPSADAWKPYHYFIHNNPEAQDFNPLEYEPTQSKVEANPITSNIVADYGALLKLRNLWKDHLNNIKTLTIIDRIALATINAALYGALCDARLLSLLPNAILTHSYVTAGIVHIELYEVIEGKRQWLTRWEPDLLTFILIAGIMRYGLKSNNTIKEVPITRIKKAIQAHLQAIGLATSGDIFNDLQEISKIQIQVEFPGFIGTQGPDFMYKNVLPEVPFVRMLTGKVPSNYSTVKEINSKTKASASSLREINSPSRKELRRATKELTKLLRKIDEDKKSGRKTGSKERLNRHTANELRKLGTQFSNAPQIFQALVDWSVFLCEYGTPKEPNLATSTLCRYIPIIANHIIERIGLQSLSSISSDQYENIYLAALRTDKDDVQIRSMIFAQFHQFVVDSYSVEECKILDEITSDNNPYAFSGANIVSDAEYQRAIEFVQKDSLLGPRLNTQYKCLLIMMFHFGLRIGEALCQQKRDIQINEDSNRIVIQVRKRTLNRLKSKNAVRQVLAASTLSKDEFRVIERLTREIELTEKSQSLGLFTKIASEPELISEAEARRYLSIVLKSITQDPNVKLHTLRHSFITRNFANLSHQVYRSNLSYWYSEIAISSDNITNGISLACPLAGLSTMSGHEDLHTTFKTYVHCRQKLFNSADELVLVEQLKKVTLALFLHESSSNLRKRHKDIIVAVKKSLKVAPFFSLADSQYTEFSQEATKGTIEKLLRYQKRQNISPTMIEHVFFRQSKLNLNQSLEGFQFGLTQIKLKQLLDIAEKSEHESKFQSYQLYRVNADQELIQKENSIKAIHLSKKEHEHLQVELTHLENVDLTIWNEQQKKTFIDGVDTWKKIIDGKHNDLVADRDYMLTDIFNLANQIGFKFKCTGGKRLNGKSQKRRDSLDYVFEPSLTRGRSSIRHEYSFHKLIFILLCWYEVNHINWRTL